MAFIDEINLHLEAGRGGSGVVRWRHEKGKEWAGASGGDGGRGGDVYVKAVSDLNRLAGYRNHKSFSAKNGEAGMKSSMKGEDGEDFILEIPIGSIVTNRDTGKSVHLIKKDQIEVILKGGVGGLGNEFFKSSTNTSPKESTEGKPGEEGDFYIEVELIASAGLMGLPNAGKSSLLNALTRSHAKVGSYAFTTVEPNLGDMYGFILADIPGLIEGAAEGKGLGHKFLRHIRRTALLIHCIAADSENLIDARKIVRTELQKFDPTLSEKPEIIVITKTDTVSTDKLSEIKELFLKTREPILSVSILDESSIKDFRAELMTILKKYKE